MKIDKFKAKEYAAAALALFPLYGMAKFTIAYIKTRNMIKGQAEKEEKIQQIIESFPTNQIEYDSFIKTADPETIKLYNEALADSKLSGEVSDKFLDANGFDNAEAFFNKLDSLYAEGQTNDFAKQRFNELMTDYQNDFFGQAKEIASVDYAEHLNHFGYVDFNPTFMDTVFNMGSKTMIYGIVSVGALVYIASYVYELRKKKAKTNTVEIKNEASNPKRMERRGILGMLKKSKKDNKEADEEEIKELKKEQIEELNKETKEVKKIKLKVFEDEEDKKITKKRASTTSSKKEKEKELEDDVEFEDKFLL